MDGIKNQFEADFNLDHALKKLSSGVFSLDNQYRTILVTLTKEPSTEYQIGKLGAKYGLDRDSVRRRLLGTSSLPSLEDMKFLENKMDLFRTGKKTKQYSLTLKGICASLTHTKFEEVFNIRVLKDAIYGLTNNQFNICELITLYTKYHTALILSWYMMNNFDITKTHSIEKHFTKNFTRRVLFDPVHYTDEIQEYNHMYKEIGKRFLVLEHVIEEIISKIDKKGLDQIFKNWYIYVSHAQEIHDTKTITFYEIKDDNKEDITNIWSLNRSQIESLAKNIFDIINIKNPKKINPYEKHGFYQRNTSNKGKN